MAAMSNPFSSGYMDPAYRAWLMRAAPPGTNLSGAGTSGQSPYPRMVAPNQIALGGGPINIGGGGTSSFTDFPPSTTPYGPTGTFGQPTGNFGQPTGTFGQPTGTFTPISINSPGYNIPSSAPPAGPNPQFPAWSTGAGGGGAYSQGDPGYMASSEANRAVDYGNLFENQYGQQYTQALGQQNTYQDAANQGYNQLWQTPGYTPTEASAIAGDPTAPLAAVNATAQRTDAAIDPSKLGISDDQVQQMKNQAGRQIGLQYGAAQDQLQRQADASGDVNPLALAAARGRLMRSQAIDQADAVTQADLAARGQQRQANTNIANMRIGAATTLGGMGLQGGEYADTAAAQRAAQIAGQRIQGQQAARNYWQGQSQFQGNQANTATQARISSAQTALSGMGQGASTAAYTMAARRNPWTFSYGYGPGGATVGIGGGI